MKTYAIFLYPDEEIRWTTGSRDNGINGLMGYPAHIGFNKGDGITIKKLAMSGQNEVVNIESTKNVKGSNGVYIFDISGDSISTKNCKNRNQ